MIRTVVNDRDYLAARLHGRRSRMAEAGRLDALCRSRTLSECAFAIFPEIELATARAFQRRSVQSLIQELSWLRAAWSGAEGRLLDWLLVRFRVENLKVLLRTCLAKIPDGQCHEHLVALPKDLALDAGSLLKADSLTAFLRLLPREDAFRRTLEHSLAAEPKPPNPFFCEAVLDRKYFQELLARAGQLRGEDTEIIAALAKQEADTFHLMLVARGRFHHGLTHVQLLPLHVAGTRLSRARFAAMLGDAELRPAMERAVGRALDELPPQHEAGEGTPSFDAVTVEALAWKRFARLANRIFRQGHVGLGAIIGYAGLRRVEMANLITLSEGLRLGLPAGTLRARMIPRRELEVAHV
jgi:vacuolar-type H+-ATPase subunit C/Vma6